MTIPNPGGRNSIVDHQDFNNTLPYGEKKIQGDLQRSAPLAGQGAASTPLNAPRRAGRAAQRQPKQARPTAQQMAAAQPPAPTPPPSTADVWQQITNVPGITPLAFDYLQRAQQT